MKTYSIATILLTLLLATACTQKDNTRDTTASIPAATATESIVIKPQVERDSLKGSLKAVATGRIGNTFTTIHYHSPAVRGRVIWGGLVPFDQVWVTGAHMATAVEFEGPVSIANIDLPAGKYALFTIPSRDSWTIVINKNWEQHLVDEYDAKDDLVRVSTVPLEGATHQERLMYTIDSASITIRWAALQVALPVSSR